MSARKRPDTAALAAHLEGEVTRSERAAIEDELRDSASARRTLEQLRNLSELLAAPAPELENIDLSSRVRNAVRRVPAPEPRRAGRWLAFAVGGLAACLGCVLFFARRTPDFSEFREKAASAPLITAQRWAGIQAFRVAEHGTPEPLGATMTRSDGLLFSYTNLGPQPFDYLMIFASDAKGEVHWFYPAYEKADQNPASIGISHGRANVPLADLVQQDVEGGPLSVYALFTTRPLNVRDVEAWLKTEPHPTAPPPAAAGLLQRIETRVLP